MSVLKSLIKQVAEAGGEVGTFLKSSSIGVADAEATRAARQALKDRSMREEADKLMLHKARKGVSELISDLNDESYMAMADHQGIIDEFKQSWGLQDDAKFDELLTSTEDVDLFSLGEKKRVYSEAALDDIAYHVSKHGNIHTSVPADSMLTKATPSAVKVTESQLKRPKSAIEFAEQMTEARGQYRNLVDEVKARYLNPHTGAYPTLFEEFDVDDINRLYGRVNARYDALKKEYPIGQFADKKIQREFAERSMYRFHAYDKNGKAIPVIHPRRAPDGTRTVTAIYNEVLDHEVVRAAGLLDRSYDADAASDVIAYFTKNPELYAFDSTGKRVLYDPEDPRTFQVLMSRYHDVLDSLDKSISAGRQPFDVEGRYTDWDTTDYGYVQDVENGLALEDLEFYRAFNKLNITLSEAREKVAERFAKRVNDDIIPSAFNSKSERIWYEGGIDAVLRLHDEALAELSRLENTQYSASAKAYYQAVRDMLSLRDPSKTADAQLVLHEIDVMASWEAESAAMQQIQQMQQEAEAGRIYQAPDIFSPPGKYDAYSNDHLLLGGTGQSAFNEAFSDIKLSGEALKRDMAFTSTGRGYDTSPVFDNVQDDWVVQNELSISEAANKKYLQTVTRFSPGYMRTLAEVTTDLERTLAEYEAKNWDSTVPRSPAPEVLDTEEGIIEDTLRKKATVNLLQRFPMSSIAPRYNAKVGWNNNILRINTLEDLNRYVGDLDKVQPTPLADFDNATFTEKTGIEVSDGLSNRNRDLLYKAILATRDDVARSNTAYMEARNIEDKLPMLITRDKNLALLKMFQDRMAGVVEEGSLKNGLPDYLARWDLRAQDPIDFSYKITEKTQENYGSILNDIDTSVEDVISTMLQSLETEGVDGTAFVAHYKNSPAYLKAQDNLTKARIVIINKLTEEGPTIVIEKQDGKVVGKGKDYLEPDMTRLDAIVPEK